MSLSSINRQILGRMIQLSRGRGNYELDSSLSAASAAAVMIEKAACAARGLVRGKVFRKCGKPVFIGKGVLIRHGWLLSLGKGVNVEDFVVIDALSRHGVVIDDGCTIERHTMIKVTGVLSNLGEGFRMGSNSSIGAFSFMGAAGGITIGDNVMIGQRVSLHAENHNFEDAEVPIREQGVTRQGIVIGDDCWIGSGTVILDGVNVGKSSVIGAGSIVTKDIPENSVAFGAPAKVVRLRGSA